MNSKKLKGIRYGAAVLFVVTAILTAVAAGSQDIPLREIFKIFTHAIFGWGEEAKIDATDQQIIFHIRLPRAILAFFVGASLSIAGAAFQGYLRNPLADPYTLGVSSGAALGAVLVIFFQISLPFLGAFTLPVVSVLFALAALGMLLGIARFLIHGFKAETLILIGIILSSFLGALLSLFIALSGEELRQAIQWLLGSVGMRGWAYVSLIVPFFLIGTFMLMLNTKELNAFAFGEETARTIGVNVTARGTMILCGAALLTGSAVAVAGTIGFVGLVVPHLVRLLFGPDHRHLFPLSILFGGGFLVLADIGARSWLSPTELPIGVITSLVGAPVFAYLLLAQQRRRR